MLKLCYEFNSFVYGFILADSTICNKSAIKKSLTENTFSKNFSAAKDGKLANETQLQNF